MSFHPEQSADEAAQAFERYDLVTAPVVDAQGKLVGRLTVDAVMDYIRAKANEEALKLAGLKEEEDLFASVWKSCEEPLAVDRHQSVHRFCRLASDWRV